MSERLTHEMFAAKLNTKFRIIVDDDQSLEAELVKVSELLISERQERFSILFRAPTDVFLGQGIRRFTHEQMGSFQLFLVPIHQDDRGIYYESVFNRSVQA